MAITFDPFLNKLRKQDAGGTGAVDSVNGATGVVVLDQDDVLDGTTYKQYSATEKTKLAGIETGAQVNPDLSSYLTSATAASTYEPLKGADDNYVTDAEKTALHPAVTLGTNTASALSLSTQALSIGDVFVQNTGDTIAGDISINSGYRLGVGVAVSSLADVRINSTTVNESSFNAGIWQSTTYNPVGTPVAGTSVRGLLFQVSSAATADDLSNVILYGALGQVTHAGSGTLSQAYGMNPGIFFTGTGAVTTSGGITISATSAGGGAHGTFFGIRSSGLALSGGSTLTNNYAFYADAVAGGTNNYAFYSNGGLVHFGDNVDLTSGKTLTMPVGSIITDTTTGLKIGTGTTQKIGFYNVTPVVQASAYTQTYSTASKTVPNATASNPPAGGTGATAGAYDTAANRNAMITSLTNNIADVLALKKVVNALIDDLQAIGIIS